MRVSRGEFERALRRLDGPQTRSFVTELLAARGYRTAVDGAVVTATDGSGASMRLLIAADWRSLRSTARTQSVDAVVVTGGPAVTVARSLVTAADRGADGPDVHGSGMLYEWYAFAVDSDVRRALTERYLGSTDPTALGRVWSAVVGSRYETAWTDRIPDSGRLVLVTLVVLLAVVAATTVGPPGVFEPAGPTQLTTGGDAPVGTPGLTSVPVTITPVPTTTDAGAPVPAVCPTPPTDAHPSSLRPGVIQTASTSGLEGWQLLATQNLTEYQFDPNDQQLRSVPEVRHLAVYETPGGGQYLLGLDRWPAPEAGEAAIARGGPWTFGFSWGRYTVWAEWQSRAVESEPLTRQLLAGVRTPDGVQLGGSCVSALLSGPSTNATA